MSTLQESLRKRRAEAVAAVSCVIAEERQSALLVSVWAGDTWVLPWSQFVSAHCNGEKIELSFGNLLVLVTGENLPALLGPIAAYRISVLRELPPEYRRDPADGEPFVSHLEVRSVPAGVPIRESPA